MAIIANFAKKLRRDAALYCCFIQNSACMLLSMTGFGRGVAEIQNKKITVEIKSLNSKQMDLNSRVPSSLRSIEIDLRNIVSHSLQRGKADMTVAVEAVGSTDTQLSIRIDTLASYKAQIEQASRELEIPLPADWMQLLLRFPDVMQSHTEEELTEDLRLAAVTATNEALTGLLEHRRAEGKILETFFTERIKAIEQLLRDIEPFEKERVPQIRQRIEEGLAKIPVAEYDKGRLEQEMIFYIEKLDVNEEQQRLAQHLKYFIETLEGEPGQGKKLGFIAQEMGREINTLGSKSNHAEMQRIVVKMKDILEQIKEQVLNVM